MFPVVVTPGEAYLTPANIFKTARGLRSGHGAPGPRQRPLPGSLARDTKPDFDVEPGEIAAGKVAILRCSPTPWVVSPASTPGPFPPWPTISCGTWRPTEVRMVGHKSLTLRDRTRTVSPGPRRCHETATGRRPLVGLAPLRSVHGRLSGHHGRLGAGRPSATASLICRRRRHAGLQPVL